MKVVLIRPYYNSHIITPPLGLGYLASYLQREGNEVIIIDALRDYKSEKDVVRQVVDINPGLVGITCLTVFYNATVSMSKQLKEKGFMVVIGGVHPTFIASQTLEDSKADWIVCGEGEAPLSRLINNNLNHQGIKGIYSLADLSSGNNVLEKAEIIENLDELPFPDWEQISPATYPKAPHGALVKNFPIGVIMASRGCPYECTFCASPGFYNRRIRFRSPENVVKEIEYLVDHFGVKEIHFEDDNLTMIREKTERICNLLIEKNLNITWACPNGIRADRVDRDLIKLMKKSGCYYFAYGIESANPQILYNIKKRENISTIDKAITLADEEGIQCQGFFIFGLPGETKETIRESINFAKKTKLSRAQFLILDVLPGSELWTSLSGKFVPNWNKDSYREPEWLPVGVNHEDLLNAQSTAFREFYFRPKIFIKNIKMLKFSQISFLIQRIREYHIINSKSTG